MADLRPDEEPDEETVMKRSFQDNAYHQVHIRKVENGYVVRYDEPFLDEEQGWHIRRAVKVFLTNTDLLEFIEKYYQTEPKP